MFSLPQDKTNYIVAFTALAALIVSILALFANGLPNLFKSTKISASFPYAIQINQSGGDLSSFPHIYLRNEGGNDVAISKVVLEIVDEADRKTILTGITGYQGEGMPPIYTPNFFEDYAPRLIGTRFRPGDNLTIMPNLGEKKTRDQINTSYELNVALNKEASQNANRPKNKISTDYKNLQDTKKTLQESRQLPPLPGQECEAAIGELANKKKQLSASAIERFPTGKYSFKMVLFDEKEKAIHTSKFESILFENELSRYKDIEHPTGEFCNSFNFSNSSKNRGYYSAPYSMLKFNLEQSPK